MIRRATGKLASWAVGFALIWVAACEAAPLDQILANKACSPTGECASGYVCDTSRNICVTHLGGAGGATSTTSTASSDGTCVTVTDCPAPTNHCEAPICVGGLCGTTAVVMGAPSGLDVPNDCKNSICDGAGNAVTVNDATDLPTAVTCANVVCDNGAVLSRPARVGTACTANGGSFCDAASNCVQCLGEADCTMLPPDDECQQRVCSAAGTCSLAYTPNHTPVMAQNAGDCKVSVCNGQGVIVDDPLVTDVPDDGNDCTTQSCSTDGMVNVVDKMPGSGCSAGVCNASGQCTGCVNPSDCGSDTFCATWNCNGGTCQHVFTSNTTSLPANQQTNGDCQVLKCNGAGGTMTVPLNTDVPADDGVQCTDETCQAGSPQHPSAAFDQACTQNGTVCDGNGSCVQCNSPGECVNQGGICAHATCSSHSCGLMDTTPGTPAPVSAQMTGDCQLLVCNGSGQAMPQVDNDDLPVDGDDCTQDVCTNGSPSNPPAMTGSLCGNNGFCDASGNCSTKKMPGDPCSLDAQCESGHCPSADGVCCDTDCSGTCQACTTAKSGGTNGTCTSIPSGQDPDSECMQLGQSCNGSGACAFQCGQSPTSPGGTCPTACTGGCAGGVCFVDCNDPTACATSTIACPAGWACTVQCGALGACDDATIACPNAYACSLVCSAGACSGTDLTCSTGVCSLQCSDDGSCVGTTVSCGQNTCSAACNGGSANPALTCGSSCNCTSCQ